MNERNFLLKMELEELILFGFWQITRRLLVLCCHL